MTAVILTAGCEGVSGRLVRSVFGARKSRRSFKVNAAAASSTPKVRYSKRPEESDLFLYAVLPPKGGKVTNLEPDEVSVILNDLRISHNVTLHRNGFELVNFPSGQDINWEDEQQVCHCFACS
jgi:hypothetical protein